ncbi:hypothetical protein DLAC_08192 [Tieghemostelium lacteum]|uniref:Uncharacterized protein n=1 Tax=Tieghemostelium lacteum TaxID=361077 RepID=A0A151ZBE3_TIELA|nr:hypothetical protein DLAC_08192 [Tieghemostelium lacteum]|eukprot:KYQ91258.1 hypothetical protein DLAC_08192 [Tieghemostelium lacteum]
MMTSEIAFFSVFRNQYLFRKIFGYCQKQNSLSYSLNDIPIGQMIKHEMFNLMKEKWKVNWLSLDFTSESLKDFICYCTDLELFEMVFHRYGAMITDLISKINWHIICQCHSFDIVKWLLNRGLLEFKNTMGSIKYVSEFNEDLLQYTIDKYPKLLQEKDLQDIIIYLCKRASHTNTVLANLKISVKKLCCLKPKYWHHIVGADVLKYYFEHATVYDIKKRFSKIVGEPILMDLKTFTLHPLSTDQFENLKYIVENPSLFKFTKLCSLSILISYPTRDALQYVQETLYGGNFQIMEQDLIGYTLMYNNTITSDVVEYLIQMGSTTRISMYTILQSQIPLYQIQQLHNMRVIDSEPSHIPKCSSKEVLEFLLSNRYVYIENEYSFRSLNVSGSYFDDGNVELLQILLKYNIEFHKTALEFCASKNLYNGFIFIYESFQNDKKLQVDTYRILLATSDIRIQEYLYNVDPQRFWKGHMSGHLIVELIKYGRYQFLDYIMNQDYPAFIRAVVVRINVILDEASLAFLKLIDQIRYYKESNDHTQMEDVEVFRENLIHFKVVEKLKLIFKVTLGGKPIEVVMLDLLKPLNLKMSTICYLLNNSIITIDHLETFKFSRFNLSQLDFIIHSLSTSVLKDKLFCYLLLLAIRTTNSTTEELFTTVFMKCDHKCNPKNISLLIDNFSIDTVMIKKLNNPKKGSFSKPVLSYFYKFGITTIDPKLINGK